MTAIELPLKYYLDHFRELRRCLIDHYHSFLEGSHLNFLNDFENLSEDAQCLYLRMINRKGRFFFKDKLRYPEITSLEDAVHELKAKYFLRNISPDDWKSLISFLPKKELTQLLESRVIPHKKSWPKDQLEKLLMNSGFAEDQLFEFILVQEKKDELSYLLFLYFGKIQENLSLYTLRDLGIRKVNGIKRNTRARFRTKEEALSHYFYSRLSEGFRDILPFPDWPAPLNEESIQLRELILMNMAEQERQTGHPDKALEILRHCHCHPGREKYIRLLHQSGQTDLARATLLIILENPYSDLEYLFAEDFFARKFEGRKRSILTETLRNSRMIPVDESFFRHPEAGVLDWLKKRGVQSWHVENYIWNSLFGLIFWDELFESEKSSLFNEFDRLPKELLEKRFLQVHEKEIDMRLQQLKNKDFIIQLLITRAEDKKDVKNGIFGWHESLPELLKILIQNADHGSLKNILLYMAQDYNSRSVGFPDIMSIENGKIKFYEIKASGDSLKQHQLLQLIALQKAGFPVEVLQVEYIYNPDQIYVVVDIETTGPHLPYHRITEIGAVKMQNGVVIDKFQTLVNPGRWISREITDLTGITNEMVKNAPAFKDVASSFEEFTRGSIFVAHNVNFDYGFLQSEFERIEKKFVRPYICTKNSMRKYYPGLDSYGLKNLCSHFNISLINHHRALADAEAASELLILINQKRFELSSAK